MIKTNKAISLILVALSIVFWSADCWSHWDGECTEGLYIEPTNGQIYQANFVIDHSCSEPNNPDRFHCHRWTLDGEYHSHGYWTEADYDGTLGSANGHPCLADRTEPNPVDPDPTTSMPSSGGGPSSDRSTTMPPGYGNGAVIREVTTTACKRVSVQIRLVEGYNLVHLPIKTNATVGDLFDRTQAEELDFAIFTYDGTGWQVYDSEDDKGTAADIELTPQLGMVFYVNKEHSMGWANFCALPNEDSFNLQQGMNFVAFSELPEGIETDVDLFDLHPHIVGIISEFNGVFYAEGRLLDLEDFVVPFRGDIAVVDGLDGSDVSPVRAYFVFAFTDVTVNLNNVGAAPSIKRRGTLATSWGAMKERR